MNKLNFTKLTNYIYVFTDNTTVLHELIVHYELTYDKLNYMLFTLITQILIII